MEKVNQEFFNLFKKIEVYLGDSSSVDFMAKYRNAIKKDHRLRYYEQEMEILKSLRNIEAHNPNTGIFYMVSEKSIETLRKVLDCIEKPRKAFDICVKASNIMICDINDRIFDVVKKMQENDYSYVPVMKEGSFFGVFSANVLFRYFAMTQESILDETLQMHYLSNHIPIENHIGESFEFISKSELLAKVEDKIYKSYSTNKRLEAIFITDNGSLNNTILGMITSWDILNINS